MKSRFWMTSNALTRQVIHLAAAVGLSALMSCATNSSPVVSEIQVPARPARVVPKTPVEPVVEPAVKPEPAKFSRIDREVRNLSPSDQRSIPELISAWLPLPGTMMRKSEPSISRLPVTSHTILTPTSGVSRGLTTPWESFPRGNLFVKGIPTSSWNSPRG